MPVGTNRIVERGPSGKVYTCLGRTRDGGCATSGYYVYGKGCIPTCILCKNLMDRAQCGKPGCTAEATRVDVQETGVIVARCESH